MHDAPSATIAASPAATPTYSDDERIDTVVDLDDPEFADRRTTPPMPDLNEVIMVWKRGFIFYTRLEHYEK